MNFEEENAQTPQEGATLEQAAEQGEPQEESFDDLMSGLEAEVQDVPAETAEAATEQLAADASTEGGLDGVVEEVGQEVESKEKLDQMLDDERRRVEAEKEAGAREAIKPFEAKLAGYDGKMKVVEGELYYRTLKGDPDAYLSRMSEQLDIDIDRAETEVAMLRTYAEKTGKSLYGGDAEQAIARKESTLEQLRSKKEQGYTDDEKRDFRNYQGGVRSSLEGRGMSVPVIHEGHMGYKGREYIESPSSFIDQMKKVRDYRTGEEYNGRVPSETDVKIHDDVYGYDKTAQGMAFAALEAGDAAVAAKALAFAEGIRKMAPEDAGKVKSLISGMDAQKKKAFVDAYKKAKEGGGS